MADTKIKVLVIPAYGVANACDLYRNINPFKYSKRIEYKIGYEIPSHIIHDKKTGQPLGKIVDDDFIKWADIVLFVRYYYADKLPLVKHLVDKCVKFGKKIVYETDDLLHEVEQNTCTKEVFKRFGELAHLQTMEYILKHADLMTVSTPPLKKYYRKMVDCGIEILPNYYDPKEWSDLKTKPRTNDKFRIGWAGGANHYHKNFSILEEPLCYINKKYKDRVEIVVFCGKDPNQDWYPGHLNKYNFKFEWHQWETIQDYPQKLKDLNLDLGLVVVQDNLFSAAKSNIKWLEYGLAGVPCIASDVGPYKKTTALLVKNKPQDWIKAMEEMMTNKEKYSIIRQETIERVKDFDITKHYHKWDQAYEKVFKYGKGS